MGLADAWGRIVIATRAGVGAFREAMLDADPDPSRERTLDDWGSWPARTMRNELNWAFYQNDAYRPSRRLSGPYKSVKGLYRHVRGVYNPTARLMDFWQTHLLGGRLDRDAGDGTATASSLPIEGASDPLRAAIATLWRDGNFQEQKSKLSLYGPLFADPILRVVDDAEKGQVYLLPVHPSTVAWKDQDARGNIKAYSIEEKRLDPRPSGKSYPRWVRYQETAERGAGDDVLYRTYLDGSLYHWPGNPGAEWTVPYGFIPLFVAQHINAGLLWGIDELHTIRVKVDEVNDMGAKLHDFIRVEAEGLWLAAGVSPPDPAAKVTKPLSKAQDPASTSNKAEPAREVKNVMYTPDPNAKVHSMVSNLSIPAVTAEIRASNDNLEDDRPELRFERLRAAGQISGEALRVARQPVSTRVKERRAAYDHLIMRAQAGSVAIGGYRGYRGYEGFSLDSYRAGALDHQIGDRPVFAVETLDRIQEDTAEALMVKAWVDAGLSLDVALKWAGKSDADVALAMKAAEAQARAAAKRQADLMSGAEQVPGMLQ